MWPENWPAVELFVRMGTQWRAGLTRPVGLDYGVLFRLMDDAGITAREERRALLDDIQSMEAAALEKMAET